MTENNPRHLRPTAANVVGHMMAVAQRSTNDLPISDLILEVRRYYDGPLTQEGLLSHIENSGNWQYVWNHEGIYYQEDSGSKHGKGVLIFCQSCDLCEERDYVWDADAEEYACSQCERWYAKDEGIQNLKDEIDALSYETDRHRRLNYALDAVPGLTSLVEHAVSQAPMTATEYVRQVRGTTLDTGQSSYLGRLASQAATMESATRREMGPGGFFIEVKAWPRHVWDSVWTQFVEWREARVAS